MYRHARDFQSRGRLDDPPSPDRVADWVGEAIFNGHIAVWSWPAEEVRQLLAPGLELADQPFEASIGKDHHPVVFAYGEQTRGANFFAGIPIRSGLAYHEAGMFVPFVRKRGHVGTPRTAVPRMYADFFPPVWHDEAYYGFGKQLVEFREEGALRLCLSADGCPLLDLAVEPRGPWQPAVSCTDPVLALIQAAATLPVVGRMKDGSFVGSHFLWDFRPATLRAADSTVELAAGVVDRVKARTCPDVTGGTFEVRDLVWRLGWPGRCEM